jgi:hypothetical protein
MTKSDPNRVLRRLPLVVGGLGAVLLLMNRLLTPELTNSQARGDVLGVILSAVLILTGLIWQQVQPRTPETVELIGEEGFFLDPELPEAAKIELAWATRLLLTNTVTRSLIVYYQGKVLLRRGILAAGKIEFDYLPENTQGVICQPIGKEGVLILAANAPRSYTKQDENWIAGIADKLAVTLGHSRS